MPDLFQSLKNLQNQPEGVRRRASFVLAFSITAVIFVGWVTSLVVSGGNSGSQKIVFEAKDVQEKNNVNTEKPWETIKIATKDLLSAVSGFTNSLKNIKSQEIYGNGEPEQNRVSEVDNAEAK